MTVIMALVEVRSNKRSEFLNIMQDVALKTKENHHCEKFEIYQDVGNENIFSFFGSWENPNELQMHLKSDQFTMVLIALKLLKKNPEIRYFKDQTIVGIYGLKELINIMQSH